MKYVFLSPVQRVKDQMLLFCSVKQDYARRVKVK